MKCDVLAGGDIVAVLRTPQGRSIKNRGVEKIPDFVSLLECLEVEGPQLVRNRAHTIFKVEIDYGLALYFVSVRIKANEEQLVIAGAHRLEYPTRPRRLVHNFIRIVLIFIVLQQDQAVFGNGEVGVGNDVEVWMNHRLMSFYMLDIYGQVRRYLEAFVAEKPLRN